MIAKAWAPQHRLHLPVHRGTASQLRSTRRLDLSNLDTSSDEMNASVGFNRLFVGMYQVPNTVIHFETCSCPSQWNIAGHDLKANSLVQKF